MQGGGWWARYREKGVKMKVGVTLHKLKSTGELRPTPEAQRGPGTEQPRQCHGVGTSGLQNQEATVCYLNHLLCDTDWSLAEAK